jgi:hypothetical protein
LLTQNLTRVGIPDPPSLLDAAAANTRVEKGMPAGDAEYVQSLNATRTDLGAAPQVDDRVMLPRRLSRTVLTHGLESLIGELDGLPSARRWERAAVVSGQTMTEWGTWAALEWR